MSKDPEARRGRVGRNDLPEPHFVLGPGLGEEVDKDQITKGLERQAMESEVYLDEECGFPEGF